MSKEQDLEANCGSMDTSTAPDGEEKSSDEEVCPICLESFSFKSDDDDDECRGGAKERVVVDACGHTFCRDCILRSISTQLDAKTVPAVCPAPYCRNSFSTDAARAIIAPETTRDGGNTESSTLLKRYVREEKLKNDANVACIRCHEVFQTNPTQDDLVCAHCSHAFCRAHGDVHSGISCASYRHQGNARQIQATERALAKFTRLCPECGIPIQKSGGCNHVTCARCKQRIDWRNCKAPETRFSITCLPAKRFLLRLCFAILFGLYLLIALTIQAIWLPFAAVLSILGYMIECLTFPCRDEHGGSWIFEVWFLPSVLSIMMFDQWHPARDRFPAIASLLDGDTLLQGIVVLLFVGVVGLLWLPFGIAASILGGGACAIICRCPMELQFLQQLTLELLFFPFYIGQFQNEALAFADPFSETYDEWVDEIPVMEV